MTEHASLVHALVAFGLNELDAWNCVHHAGAATAAGLGRDSFVLLRCDPEQALSREAPLADISTEQIAAAAELGVSWRSVGAGQWTYLRRLDWGVDQLSVLHEDVSRLADTLARHDRAGGYDPEA